MQDLLALCADVPLRSWQPGEILIEFGRVVSVVYVLASGSVTVERDGVVFSRIDAPGAIFGEMSVVLGTPATATARAASTVVCHVIEDPEVFLTERPGAALAVLRLTASRLDAMTKYLVDVERQLAEEEGHLGMLGHIADSLRHHQPTARPGSARDPEG
jgi:CRP/FNR family cyclic AMP-dependent transcriptional regulator